MEIYLNVIICTCDSVLGHLYSNLDDFWKFHFLYYIVFGVMFFWIMKCLAYFDMVKFLRNQFLILFTFADCVVPPCSMVLAM